MTPFFSFLRPPGRVLATFLQDQLLHFFSGRTRAAFRTTAPVTQASTSLRLIALQVFMTRLTADPKVRAQLSYRESARLSQYYKSFFLGHYIGFFPWHYAI